MPRFALIIHLFRLPNIITAYVTDILQSRPRNNYCKYNDHSRSLDFRKTCLHIFTAFLVSWYMVIYHIDFSSIQSTSNSLWFQSQKRQLISFESSNCFFLVCSNFKGDKRHFYSHVTSSRKNVCDAWKCTNFYFEIRKKPLKEWLSKFLIFNWKSTGT